MLGVKPFYIIRVMKKELTLLMFFLGAMTALCQKPTRCYDLTGEMVSEQALQALEETSSVLQF